MRKKLRLYVWTNYSPDYTDGLAFAIARDEIEARKLVTKARGNEPFQWGTLTVHELGPVAYEQSGGV